MNMPLFICLWDVVRFLGYRTNSRVRHFQELPTTPLPLKSLCSCSERWASNSVACCQYTYVPAVHWFPYSMMCRMHLELTAGSKAQPSPTNASPKTGWRKWRGMVKRSATVCLPTSYTSVSTDFRMVGCPTIEQYQT